MRLVNIGTSPNFYVEWRENKQKRRVSTGTADRTEAEDFLAAFRLEYGQEPAETWPDIATTLNWYYASHAATLPSSQQAAIAIRHLVGFFGSTAVDKMKRAKQAAYVEKRQAAGISNETIRRELSVLSAALKRAYSYEKLPAPAPPVIAVPESPPRERFLTRQEAAKLLRHLHRNRRQRHLLLFARLALYTGARSGALLELTWDRVDFERGLISYPLPGRVQTNKRSAVVPIAPSLARGLVAAKARARTGHVIEWAGKSVRSIKRAFGRQAGQAGLGDVTPHTLRHTFGTWAAQGGESLFLISRALGHRRTTTTERYAKYQPDALRGVTEAVRRGKVRGK